MFIGDHRSHNNFEGMAKHILGNAPEKFVYAGLSMGGYAGFEIMRQAPERVKALILMNTSVRPDGPEQTERRKGLIEMAKTQGLGAVVDAVLPAFLAEQNLKNTALTDKVRKMAEETGLDTFLNQMAAIIGRVDSQPTLQTISCPTLVIVGANDTLTPPELAREIVNGVSGAQLVVIDDCGHLSALEQPDAVSQAIKTFLQDAGI
jgi:pimeloyl-ACP methyl ester carboxylesterase